jgi:hypothetical protein
MDYHGTPIPKFTDILFNLDLTKKLQFSNIIVNTIGHNNEMLVENLSSTIPELRIDQVRKFNSWKNLHSNTNRPINKINNSYN